MMHATARWSSVLGLLGLLLWAGNAQAVSCENNLPPNHPNWVYTDHGDGTVTDKRTGLMWKQCAEGFSGTNCQVGSRQDLTWAEALALAEASTFANYNDWRLPNVKELFGLVEECRSRPAINTNLFPNTPDANFWSSSPSARQSAATALRVEFATGHAGGLSARSSSTATARFVRGGR